MKNNPKAIVLFSGGLDSMLAVKLMQLQKLETEALTFVSNFYDAEKAKHGAGALNVKLHIFDIKKEMLELTKNPPSGYGKNLNPCIDCHSMMMRLAGKYVQKEMLHDNFFLVTGEVLGQRPFSQTRQALERVQKLAKQEILRPLSAKLMPVTGIEKDGIVKRHLLLDINGRGRERQMALAKKYNLNKYPTPAGGCLLTDVGFSGRLNQMFEFWPECNTNDVEILKYGRVYWLEIDKSKLLIVIGRHAEDNEKLEKLAQTGDFMVELKEINGPLALVRGIKKSLFAKDSVVVPNILNDISKNSNNMGPEILKLVGYFATKARGTSQTFHIKQK